MIDVDVVREHGADREVVRVVFGTVAGVVIVNDRLGEAGGKGVLDPENLVVLVLVGSNDEPDVSVDTAQNDGLSKRRLENNGGE